MDSIPPRQIRAHYNDHRIRVYQAFNDEIADAALAANRFVAPPFKMGRMTWIKPSFLWMMYRCGWAAKDDGQRRVLAIDISRQGWEWALLNCALSEEGARLEKVEARALMDSKPVRVQWDPERDIDFQPLAHRSIQVGLTGAAVNRYVHEWIVDIHDVTGLAVRIGQLVALGHRTEATALLPIERTYPTPPEVAEKIGINGLTL
jgi:Domain of unknown function (DUF4291)